MQTFGESLRQLRQKRMFSLGQLSLRSGVGKATLSRWESGGFTPRIPELSRVLDALGASVATRTAFLSLLDAPRAVIAARRDTHATVPLSLGDLLYGLRHRSGKTQAEIARAAGVSRSLYAQWEGDTIQPPADQLHQAAFALGASANEVATLSSRRFAHVSMENSRDAVLFSYQKLFEIGKVHTKECYDLQLLALLTHSSRLLRQGKAHFGDVGLMVAGFGNSAMDWGDDVAAQGFHHRRALALANRSGEPIHFHLASAVRSLLDIRINPRSYKERIADALAWLPRLADNAGKAYLLMFIAQEMAKEEPDAAMRLADEYCALVADDPSEYPCRLQDRGNLLLKCGRHGEGVAFIAATASQDAFREGLKQLALAKGLIALGSHTEARACLDTGRKILAPLGYAYTTVMIAQLERALV